MLENTMFELIEIIPSELGLMVVGLYLIGTYLRSCSFVKNEFIPVILCIVGVVSSCMFLKSFSIQNIYYGVISSAIAVGVNQVKVQICKLKK